MPELRLRGRSAQPGLMLLSGSPIEVCGTGSKERLSRGRPHRFAVPETRDCSLLQDVRMMRRGACRGCLGCGERWRRCRRRLGSSPTPRGCWPSCPVWRARCWGGWGTWAGVRALQAQRTALVIAEGFASLVVRVEGAQYRQLLGSGPTAPDGRIDLAFSASATGVGGSRGTGTLEGVADYYRGPRPGRLIVTGTPSAGRGERGGGDAGTGMTVLVLSLILGLAAVRSPHGSGAGTTDFGVLAWQQCA